MSLGVYLSGEIHTDWRERIQTGCRDAGLDVTFHGPVTDHSASDNCGDVILGIEATSFWKDHKAAKINAIRTRTAFAACDLVVVRFADKYRQWNAAFDAGMAAANGKPYIVLHDEELTHALKEVDAGAQAVAQTPEQIVEILKYVLS